MAIHDVAVGDSRRETVERHRGARSVVWFMRGGFGGTACQSRLVCDRDRGSGGVGESSRVVPAFHMMPTSGLKSRDSSHTLCGTGELSFIPASTLG